ncbi:reductive dehalogenase [Bacteroidota bacterium]
MAKKDKKKDGVSRREFIKMGGAVAAGVQIGAVAAAGLAAGKDPSTLTGWQHLGDNTQFVNRKPLEIDGPAYETVGKTGRPEAVDSIFNRSSMLMNDAMKFRRSQTEEGGQRSPMKMPPRDQISEPLASYYNNHPGTYELDKTRIEFIQPKKREDSQKYGGFYTLINAWSDSWGSSERISGPPEESDFPRGYGGQRKPVPFKSPKLASELIKKVTHHFGASMVGITKLNPDFCYNYGLRGSKDRGSYKVPEHWKYVIAFGVPHQWEQVQSNPNMGTSFDAYSRSSIAARRLENFIKSLGYPARRHSPNDGYDVIGIPILVEAGLGQQGRHGIAITPETGSNFRSAFVTTNLPMEIDKPIDFGVNEFCAHCKICAEICPSQSISFEDTNEKMITRGYRHWEINQTSCYNFWTQSMGGMGCRLCLIACPYSRKNNWVHKMARRIDTNDPTNLANKGFTWMQKKFFDTPAAMEYLPPPDGKYANFREPPEWLSVEKYLDIDAINPMKGE